MNNREYILIVDDDKIIANNLKMTLEDEGYNVITANHSSVAIEEIKKQAFSVILLDLVLPEIGGIELLRMFSNKYPDTNFIIFTGYASLASAIEALKVGAYDYIIKPFDVEHLKLVVRRAIEKQKLVANNKYLFERTEKEKQKLEIILKSYEKIINIFDLAELADLITEKAVQIAEAEKASLMVLDEESQELVLKGSKGLNKDIVTWKKKIGELIAGWVAKEGKALVVGDIESEPQLKHLPGITKYKTKSFVSLPLKVDHKIIGVMNVTDKLAETEIFTEEDLRYLSLLAHQAVAQIENIRLYEKLVSFAITDTLTGLFNHRYFQEHIHIEMMRAQRYKHPLSLVMFDIDNFKTYNDRYGHLTGDRILKKFAQVLLENTRKVDIVCRYGGEEFILILPDTELHGAQILAEKIRSALESVEIAEEETNESFSVTVSGGVAIYTPDIAKNVFIAGADEAMYLAKKEGKNRICVYK